MIDIGKFLTEVRARATSDPLFGRLALMFQQLQDGINQLGTLTGTDPTAHIEAPAPPQGITVKAANGLAYVTITDTSQRSRGLHYFVEASTSPAFLPAQTHTENLVTGRSRFFTLPAKNDSGGAQSWYFRTYSMYPGSQKRSEHQVLGGSATPTAVNVGGTTQLTPLASTGSGTTSQAGEGFGTSQFSALPPNVPKQP